MERRRHPTYARRTAQITYGLVVGGLACLVLGQLVRYTAWRDLETILNVAFAVAAVLLAVHWLKPRETTICPGCGKTLTALPSVDERDPLTFPCVDCDIEWTTAVEE
jgi:hypothetical protein